MDHNKVENTTRTNNKRKFSDINQNESDNMNKNAITNRKRKATEIDHYQSNNNYNNKRHSESIYNERIKKFRINDLLVLNITKENPLTYTEAINCPEKLKWIKAINRELKNLYHTKTMTFVRSIPTDANLINTKWVFTIKRDENNNITKYKARLVAKGYKQEKGKDYNSTYSPTLNTDSIRLMLSIAARLNWKVQQLDIKAAYLNAKLDVPIYVNIPEGDKKYKKGYWRLEKALYGLKQAGRQWFITISKFIIKNGFHQLNSEHCIFKRTKNNKLVAMIGLYVDDMIICGTKPEVQRIIQKIKGKFKISNCESIKYILGIKIEKQENHYLLSQENLITNLLKQYKITNTKKTKTPCVGDNAKSENKTPFDITTYKSAIGSLLYIAKTTRPDIAFSVNKASRKCENPNKSDWKRVINILKYLNSTKNYKLKIGEIGPINAYTDSDFAGDTEDRKSTSGHLILFGNSPISWGSKKTIYCSHQYYRS